MSAAGRPSAKSHTAHADPRQEFRLYVTAASPLSSRAITNTRRLLEHYLQGQYQLSVVNISDHVALARADQVIVSPTLIRLQPLPLRRLIGDMSNIDAAAQSLGFVERSSLP